MITSSVELDPNNYQGSKNIDRMRDTITAK